MAAAVATALKMPVSPMEPGMTGILRPVLLITTVDIGDGKSDQIEYRKGDDAMEVARHFVNKHGLPPSITMPLAQHILDNLKQALNTAKPQARSPKPSPRGLGILAGRLPKVAQPCPVLPSPNSRPNSPPPRTAAEDAAVFQRLYKQALKLREKLEERKYAIEHEEWEKLNQAKVSMSWISQEMMKERSQGPFDNYGEMLYAEGLEALAKKHHKAEKYRQQKEQAEVAGVTFQPEISSLAKSLWSATELQQAPAWQRLSQSTGKKSKTQERLEMLRREKEDAETSECTFRPQINSRSEKLMTERTETLKNLNVTAHQQLFQDAVRRQHKQAEYAHWYPEEVTFQPKLVENTLRDKLHKNAQKRDGLLNTGEPQLPLVERLYRSYEKLQVKLAEARQKLEGPFEPATGRRLYHPETGRGPQRVRTTSSQNVGEYLYQASLERSARFKQAVEDKERKRDEEAKSSKVISCSQNIIRKLQKKRFRQIFEFLDQERTGVINLLEIGETQPEYLDQLDDEVRTDVEMAYRLAMRRAQRQTKRVDSTKSDASTVFMPPPSREMMDSLRRSKKGLQPAVGGSISNPSSPRPLNSTSASMEGIDVEVKPTAVTLEVFIHLMDDALASRRGPRAYLAPSPPPRYQPAEDFTPRIAERSKQLAAKLRPADVPVYEVLHQEASNISARLNEKRKQYSEDEIKDCTFHPKLVSEPLVKEGRIKRALRDHHNNTWKKGGSTLEVAGPAAGEPYNTTLEELAEQLMALSPKSGLVNPAFAEGWRGEPAHVLAGGATEALDITGPSEERETEEVDDERYLELEQEVQEMLEATNVVAAAAERLSGGSDQQYLSEILGLTQAQVDAMEPVMSSLPYWETCCSSISAHAVDTEACTAEPSPRAQEEAAGSGAVSTSRFSVPGGEQAAAAAGGYGQPSPSSFKDVDDAIQELNAEIGQLMRESTS